LYAFACPDANCRLSVADHCLRSVNYINVIVAEKQLHLQYFDIEAAIAHCTGAQASGIGRATIRRRAECGHGESRGLPDNEAFGRFALLRQYLPDVKICFVNVVDPAQLVPNIKRPHGLTDREFEALFTSDKPVVFNFHAYPWLVHRLTDHRLHQHHIHVRGYKEQDNINTPLEVAVRNQTGRFNLAIDAIDRMSRFRVRWRERSRALLNQ
jgi:xylulose-5-phosphate/fructose-6-phosphate phosphoketolase